MRRSKSNLHHCDFSQWFLMGKNNDKQNIGNKTHRNKRRFIDKRCLSAEDYSLLSSALRPRLLSKNSENITFRDKIRVKITSNYAKNYQKSSFFTKFGTNLIKNMQFLAIFMLFFGIFTIFNAFSYDDVSAASLELTVPSNFNIDLDPGTGTTFGESSNQQISIKTSGSFGYTLNIKPSDGTELKNGSNTIKAITKTEGYDSSDDYKNSDEANTWAYKPSKLNSLDNTKYLPFPSIDTVLAKTDASNDTANNYDLTIAAKVDNTLPSGKYNNNFVISATANTVSYSITYNLNEGEWNGTSPQTGTVTEDKIKLDSNTPTKENYEFLGWCSEPTSDENCNGETKQPGDEITLTNSDNQFTFYSIWKIHFGEDTMQGWTGCNNLSQHQTITLKDARDNNAYIVSKFKDGRCWMTQNLRLINKKITSEDSDIEVDSYEIPGSNSQWPARVYAPDNNDQSVLYNWHIAVAVEWGSSVSIMETVSSICPRGWKIPSSSIFSNLVNLYGSSLVNSPTNFSNASSMGCWSTSMSGCGTAWHSSTMSDTGASTIMWVGGSTGPSNIDANGHLIRCVAK